MKLKNALAIVIGLFVITSIAHAEAVPKVFQGKWTSTKCGINDEAQHLYVDTKSMQGHAVGTCDIAKITSNSEKKITADFKCANEGEEYTDSFTLEVTAKNQLVVNGEKFTSCKK